MGNAGSGIPEKKHSSADGKHQIMLNLNHPHLGPQGFKLIVTNGGNSSDVRHWYE
jgi:hypothetical protein